jgi:TfoX/Sxy family transcriptional regulator of competence genes
MTAMKKGVRKKPAPSPTAGEGVDPSFLPIVQAFARQRDVTRKRMFSSSSVLSVDGKIFAMLVKGRFVAKLPRDRVDDIVAAGFGMPFDPGHGRLMKEWVSVDAKGPPWLELAREAYRFVKTGKG